MELDIDLGSCSLNKNIAVIKYRCKKPATFGRNILYFWQLSLGYLFIDDHVEVDIYDSLVGNNSNIKKPA